MRLRGGHGQYALALLVATYLAAMPAASHALPNLLNVQGKLANINDEALVGEYTFMFRIYSSETGGLPLWTETKLLNTTSQGLFSTLLGSTTALTLNFSENYFVEVTVNGETMIPRYTVGSTSYSFKTNMTDYVSSGGIALGNFIVTNNLTVGGTSLFVDNSTVRVGIGTTSPKYTLDVAGTISGLLNARNITGDLSVWNNKITLIASNITGDLSVWNNKITVDVSNVTGDFSIWNNKTQLNAANITSGTFGAGGYTFPENLIIARNLTVSNNILFISNLTENIGIGTLTPQSKLQLAGNLNVTGLAYILSTPTASSSNGTVYLGRTSDGFESLLFDTSLGSNGKFVFSAPIQVAAQSPAITFYDPSQPTNASRQKSLVYNATATYPISFSTGVEINGSLSVLGSSPATITFGSGSSAQTLQFDPNNQEFKFSGGKIKQDFANIIKNGGFESFSGGSSWSGDQISAVADGWSLQSGTSYQYAPASYSVGSDIFQGYNALRVDPSNGQGKVSQAIMAYKLQPNKTYSIGVWARATNSSFARLNITGTALLSGFSEQSTSASSWTLIKGQFTTKNILSPSDSIVVELKANGTAGSSAFFDAVQLNLGNVLSEYQETPITGVGDQTIYGGLRLQRTGSGRGGVLTVDTSVKTRTIEFSYNTDAGWGGIDPVYMNDPRYNYQNYYSYGNVYLELVGNNKIQAINPAGGSRFSIDIQSNAGPILSAAASERISVTGTTNTNILNVTDGQQALGVYAGNLSGNRQGVSIGSLSNGEFRLYSNNTDRMTIDTSGNVGIGTTAPKSKLDISGSAQVAAGGSVLNVTGSGDVVVLI